MYQQLRAVVAKAFATRTHAFTVCIGLTVVSILLLYNGLVDVPDSPRANTQPVVIVCLAAGLLGFPLVAFIWFRDVNDPRILEAAVFFSLVAAMGVNVWTEYEWPDIATGTLGYAMLILLAAGALLRNEILLGVFLLGGMAAWFFAEGGASRASDLPPDNRTLVLASSLIAVAFHASLRFERHVARELTSRLAEQAHNDALTGLLNREGMFRQTRREETGQEQPLWCLYADVDYFKSINDEFGHNRGDEVLEAVAEAITRSLPPEAWVARWGGDEFVAIGWGKPPSETETETWINRQLESSSPGPRLTVGVATSHVPGQSTGPGSDRSIENLVKSADRRMYVRRNEIRGDPEGDISRNH
ncbi:MAG: GGDEF domain-containing protein [Actinomycetota bacterium]|nr:GGDEF domain-containing protein [Actinomycetota bacterium]